MSDVSSGLTKTIELLSHLSEVKNNLSSSDQAESPLLDLVIEFDTRLHELRERLMREDGFTDEAIQVMKLTD